MVNVKVGEPAINGARANQIHEVSTRGSASRAASTLLFFLSHSNRLTSGGLFIPVTG